MKQTIVRDVSDLPTYGYGPKGLLWWGANSFMLIEGLGFVFAVATYLYFMSHNTNWPLGALPSLKWSTALTVFMILSEAPNLWVKKRAKEMDVENVRIGLIVMTVVGIICIALRGFEFTTVNIRWDTNAYGSITWFILVLHTIHLLTDTAETAVMAVSHWIGPVDARRFPEVEDNQNYWHFITVSWILLYGLLYWVPRWFGVPA